MVMDGRFWSDLQSESGNKKQSNDVKYVQYARKAAYLNIIKEISNFN